MVRVEWPLAAAVLAEVHSSFCGEHPSLVVSAVFPALAGLRAQASAPAPAPAPAPADDDFAKTRDLEMMYKVQKLVRVLHVEGSALLPGDAPVNRDVLAPTSKL